ncbi:MAG: ATP-dependent DNA helicase RecG [Sphaerochaeta sp.]|jgi:ATP-dependent DNA helicase RecG|nr:ATP-dependent DNA helicase RecG [Sphaerochaeta sp.]
MDGRYLRNLTDGVEKLSGVGPAAQASYREMDIVTKSDLLALSPRSWEDRSVIRPIDQCAEGEYANTRVQVVRHEFFGGRSFAKRTLKVIVRDCEGARRQLSLLCFGRNFLEHTLLVSHFYYLYALIQQFHGVIQSTQFEVVPWPEEDAPPPQFGQILPIYPLRGSLTQRIIRRDVKAVLDSVPRFQDELPASARERFHLMDTDTAIRALHFPTSEDQRVQAQRSLAFDELFYLMWLTRRHRGEEADRTNRPSAPNKLELKCIESLPFHLTEDQMTSLKEIRSDLDSETPMNRLLQGDVGSGKTLVAWLSALHVLPQGRQVAFMAPTELLARQHANSAARLLEPLGIRLAFLTGSVKGKQRTELLEHIKQGEVDIVIGTHALFSKEVEFHDLGYVIIDEQHRFGVDQRLALTGKAKVPDLLLMTATPIPRTLSLTVFGSVNVSTLKTMPPGRKPVTTYLVRESSRERMYQSIGVELKRGHQAYFVYPRIDDSGQSDLRDVTSMYDFLKTEYPGVPAALMHSKLEEQEKVDILEKFQKGELRYLVSTSVVEVGIDIPNATCMVIEHAERFGLAALHQLRGRVGRSELQSYCFLVFGDDLTEEAKERLSVMKQTNDGFLIAEKDLAIRGAGDLAGVKQSGFINLKYASLSDIPMLEDVKTYLDEVMAKDPGLLSADHEVIRRTLDESPMYPVETAS